MSDYLYGNTRLRAMKSRLLTSGEFLSLTTCTSVDDLLLRLSRGVYRDEIELVSAQYSGMEAFSHFFRLQQESTIKKLLQFYTGKIKNLVERILWHYEVFNLKTILRGQAVQEDSALISSTLIHTGLIPNAVLTSLVGAQDIWQVINRVFSMGLPYAEALKNRDGQIGLSLIKLETSLEQWYFDFARQNLPNHIEGKEKFTTTLNFEADLINLILGFRSVSGRNQDWTIVKEQLVPPGNITLRQIRNVINSEDLRASFQQLIHTPFRKILDEVIETYTRYQNLTDVEKSLRTFRLNWYKKLIFDDPLGLGVPLGFLVLKQNEQRNLSWIGRGIHFGLPEETIRNNLELTG